MIFKIEDTFCNNFLRHFKNRPENWLIKARLVESLTIKIFEKSKCIHQT